MPVRTITRRCCVAFIVLASSPWLFAGTTGLAWDPSSGATSYRVYQGPSPGQYTSSTNVGNVTQTTISGLPDCVATYFAVTASNSAGESGYSNEVFSWPRPSVGVPSPASAMQGAQFTLDVNGMNFQSGATLEIDNPQVFLNSATVPACDRIQAAATVEPTAQDVRPAELGLFSLTVTNPNQLSGVGTQVFEVLVNPARFDVVSQQGPSQGRLDGRDAILLSRLFGSQEGDALYDPDVDFNGDGWVDGEDLAYLAGNLGKCWTGSSWDVSACPESLR